MQANADMVDPELQKILEEGQPIIPGRFIGPCQEAEVVGVPAPAEEESSRIEVIREGDYIRAIEVTCACGRKTRIRCDYMDAQQ